MNLSLAEINSSMCCHLFILNINALYSHFYCTITTQPLEVRLIKHVMFESHEPPVVPLPKGR